MDFKEFMGQVQHRLELAELGEAVRATRATLSTLGERLQSDEAKDLASALPMEVDRYLLEADSGQTFSFDEFLDRLSERSGEDPPDALYDAELMIALLDEIVPGEEMAHVRAQLPAEFERLFEVADREE